VVLALAKCLELRDPEERLGVQGLLVPLALALVPVALIMLEPDLGTAVSILFISGSMVLFFGFAKTASDFDCLWPWPHAYRLARVEGLPAKPHFDVH